MQAERNKAGFGCYERIFGGRITQEETMESVVPDTMPDMEEILSAEGQVFLRSKEPQQGKLLLTGVIAVSVLFRGMGESCPQRLSLEMPFETTAEGSDITQSCLSTAEISLGSLDALPLNPRKLQIRASLLMKLSCYSYQERSLAVSVENETGREIHQRTEELTTDIVKGVYEKNFILTDEFPLSGTKSPARELLEQNVVLLGEEVKFVGSKMVFKGTIKTQLLWVCEDDTVCSGAFTSGFSQIMETDVQREEAAVELSLSLTGAFFELLYAANETKSVSAQLNILAQAVCREKHSEPYIADAYCNAYGLTLTYGPKQSYGTWYSETLKDNMRGLIEMPEPVREVLFAKARPGKWIQTDKEFACPMIVSLLFRDQEGMLHSLERCFTAKWALSPETEGETPELENVCCSELYATPSSGGIEVRLLAQAQQVAERLQSIQPLDAIALDPEQPVDLEALPSVVLLPGREGDLWELAKKYHSTVALIEEANQDSDSSTLLIPKGK